MRNIIKIDLKELYDRQVINNSMIFNVTPCFNQDGTYTIKEWGVTGDILNIMHWFYNKLLENQQKNVELLRKKMREGDLEWVEKEMDYV